MSVIDDTEFLESIIKRNEMFIASQVASMRQEANAAEERHAEMAAQFENSLAKLKAEVERLNSSVKEKERQILELQNKQSSVCSCHDTITRVLLAGIGELNNVQTGQTATLPISSNIDNQLAKGDPDSMATVFVPTAGTSSAEFGNLSSTDFFYPATIDRKRKLAEATSQTIHKLEDVADPLLQERLKPFYKTDRMATHDLLNDLQRALVKQHAYELYINRSQHISLQLANEIIREGVTNHLWEEEWRPQASENFNKYLVQRLKNEKKRMVKRALQEDRNERIEKFIEESMAENVL